MVRRIRNLTLPPALALVLFSLGTLAPISDLWDKVFSWIAFAILLAYVSVPMWEYHRARQADQSSSAAISSRDQVRSEAPAADSDGKVVPEMATRYPNIFKWLPFLALGLLLVKDFAPISDSLEGILLGMAVAILLVHSNIYFSQERRSRQADQSNSAAIPSSD
jgi:hypothetical protein